MPVSTLYDDVRLESPIVWPAAIQVFGMPRPMNSGRVYVNGPLPLDVRPSAAIARTSASIWWAIGHAYGTAPNCGPAWLPAQMLAVLGPLPLASHHAFGPPVVFWICQA